MRKIAHWLESYTDAESIDILCDFGEKAALLADTPKGRELAQLIRKGEFAKVLDYAIPLDDIRETRYLRQAQAFFSKLEFLEIGVDKQKAAVSTLMAAEARCRETNEIFELWHQGRVSFPPDVSAALFLAQGHIARILGDRPTLDELGLRFGPGATSLTRKRESSVKRKLGRGVSCSDDLVGWARALLQEMPHLAELHAVQTVVTDEEFWGIVPVEIHTGAVSFVPKSAKTYRTTETQPTLNGMLQLAVGDEMAKRLRRHYGLDLRDQTLNQRLACIGSLTNALATLDLKSASNYLSKRVVQSLLPEDWFSLLNAARCGRTRVPSIPGTISLEMFAGMGNGFTFPLQSVIFFALARASATVLEIENPIVSVYGDDIIVDSAVADFLVKVLHYAGLVVNMEKSYFTGPFRESCGADFLRGIDVRPVYVKEALTPAILFTLHNGLIRKGFSELAAKVVRDLIHPSLMLRGPDGYGDGHLIREDWEPSFGCPKGRHRGWEGFTFETFATSAKRDWKYHPGDRVLPQYSVYTRGEKAVFSDVPGLQSQLGYRSIEEVSRPSGIYCNFLRAWVTGHSDVVEPSLPLPFGEDPEGAHWGPVLIDPLTGLGVQGRAKAPTFPGVDGYRKVTVYTLGK